MKRKKNWVNPLVHDVEDGHEFQCCKDELCNEYLNEDFTSIAVRMAKVFFSPLDYVVFYIICTIKCSNGNVKEFVPVEEISRLSNLQNRDIQKSLVILEKSNFVASHVVSVCKRRVQVWGIDFYNLINHSYEKVSYICDMIKAKSDALDEHLYCQSCKDYYRIDLCMTSSCEIQCPICKSTNMSERNTDVDNNCEKKKKIDWCESILRDITMLKSKKPLFTFSYSLTLKRCNIGDDCNSNSVV